MSLRRAHRRRLAQDERGADESTRRRAAADAAGDDPPDDAAAEGHPRVRAGGVLLRAALRAKRASVAWEEPGAEELQEPPAVVRTGRGRERPNLGVDAEHDERLRVAASAERRRAGDDSTGPAAGAAGDRAAAVEPARDAHVDVYAHGDEPAALAKRRRASNRGRLVPRRRRERSAARARVERDERGVKPGSAAEVFFFGVLELERDRAGAVVRVLARRRRRDGRQVRAVRVKEPAAVSSDAKVRRLDV